MNKHRVVGLLALALVSAGVSPSCFAEQHQLLVRDLNPDKSNHVVVVESPCRFRLAVVRGMNYGLSEWYDLVNDPKAVVNLTRHPTPWNTVNRARNDAEDTRFIITQKRPAAEDDHYDQGSLFNQLFNPGDGTAHINYIPPSGRETPRSCRVVEQNPVRAIVETKYYCGVIAITTTYAIYSSGRIGVVNAISTDTDYTVEAWRNAIIALGDPTYHFSGVAQGEGKVRDGILIDETKSWKPDSLIGLQVNFPDWIIYEVAGNTATQIRLGKQLHGQKPASDGHYCVNSQDGQHGWLRCSDLQSPYGWQGSTSAYLREYWDPATPDPFKNRTKASILLVPQPGNPMQGGQGKHGWDFFKRFYYECGKFELKAGQPLTQHYMIQLGTKGDTVLPDLSSNNIARACAEAYRTPAALVCTVGGTGKSAFDHGLACYKLEADGGKVVFEPKETLMDPVFEVSGIAGAVELKCEKAKLDFTCAQISSKAVILQVWGKLASGESVAITVKQ